MSADVCMTVQNIALQDLTESATNPRRTFDADKLRELGDSIKVLGVQIPLTVRKSKDGFEIVAGARRFRAAKLAGLDVVPCFVREIDDRTALELQIVENLQRDDVAPLEEAAGYKALLNLGVTVDDIAVRIGKSRRYVYNRLALDEKLIPLAREAALAGHLTASHCDELARLTAKNQLEALQTCLAPNEYCAGADEKDVRKILKTGVEQALSVRSLKDWISKTFHRPLSGAAFDLKAQIGACESCVECHRRSDWEFGAPETMKLTPKTQCLDPECFAKKTKAYVEDQQRRAREAGKKLARVQSEWKTQDGVLGYEHYQTVDRTTKGALEALDVETGKTVWIIPSNDRAKTKVAEAAGEPVEQRCAPLSERRATLAKRRLAHICNDLRESLLQEEMTGADMAKLHGEKWVARCVALAAVFGTEHNERCAGNVEWKKVKEYTNAESAANVLWKNIAPVLVARLGVFGLEHVPGNEAKEIARLVGRKWEDLQAEAARELPEPKSWASEPGYKPEVAPVNNGVIKGTEIKKQLAAAAKKLTPKASAKKKNGKKAA